MKNKKVFTAAIWASILLVVILSFTGLRFTNNLIHAKHLEEEGKQAESLRLYKDVLASEAKSLDDSLVVIRQSDLLGAQYREKWSSRFDSIIEQLYIAYSIDTTSLSRAGNLMQFLIDYDSKMGKMDDEAVVSEHMQRIDALCDRYIAYTDELLSQGLQPQNVMASVRIYKSKVLQYNPYHMEALARLYFLTGMSGQYEKQEEYYNIIQSSLTCGLRDDNKCPKIWLKRWYDSRTFQVNPENARLFLENLLSLQSVNFDYTELVNRLAIELNIYL